MHFLAAALAVLALGPGSTSASNVAPCDKAIIGHGSADWRSESIVAGPVGVRRHPLQQMSETGNGQLTSKMPVLVEGHTPVTVSIPPRMLQSRLPLLRPGSRPRRPADHLIQ
jgi:hypothetical protein